MKRYGMVISIPPENIVEYKKLHANTWSEVLKCISDCNIQNYSIYFIENLLFSYFEYIGDDYEGDMKTMGENSKIQEWWAVCKPLLNPMPYHKKGEFWTNMEEVFHHD